MRLPTTEFKQWSKQALQSGQSRRVLVILLAALVVALALLALRVSRERTALAKAKAPTTAVAAPSAQPVQASASAPPPVPAPIIAPADLTLSLEPFIETADPQRVELGRITDYSTSNSPSDSPTKPRIALQGYPLLTVETTGPRPSHDIIFLYHWYDAKGTPMGVRDSYHMLRASIDVAAEDAAIAASKNHTPRFVDSFAGIPARHGATHTAFYIQDSSQRSATKSVASELALFGQKILRAPLSGAGLSKTLEQSSSGAVSQAIDFAPHTASNITGRGVHFTIKGIAAVSTIQANHDLMTSTTATEHLIGSMVPQVIGYKTTTGEFRTLYFAHADLLKFSFDPMSASLAIDAYNYEFRERSTRSSTRHADADLRRVHPNLGIVDKLPPGNLTITHTRSSTLAFPLWQPKGALASLAITEHADFVGYTQDMQTMFGGDAPTVSPGSGILGNRIPLTKSVFAIGPGQKFLSRTASTAIPGSWMQSTLEGTPPFIDQLRKYRADGYDVEIGAHCIAGSIPNNQRKQDAVARALNLLAEFKPVTWVDHGGAECLWESGWDPLSPHYIIPLLHQHRFKYLNALGDKYDGRINMIADNQPSNLLFYSVGLDDNLDDDWKPLVFNTVPLGFTKENFTTAHVAEIIRARGLINIHTYLPYESLMFEKDGDGPARLKPNPWYNDILANLARANKAGDLHLATNARLNDFIWQVRNLRYFTIGNTIHLRNEQSQPVQGLALGIRDMSVPELAAAKVAGIKPDGGRQRDGVTYVWFDLPAHTPP